MAGSHLMYTKDSNEDNNQCDPLKCANNKNMFLLFLLDESTYKAEMIKSEIWFCVTEYALQTTYVKHWSKPWSQLDRGQHIVVNATSQMLSSKVLYSTISCGGPDGNIRPFN